MSSKVYMVNNNAESEETMAVISIDDNDYDVISSFILELNSGSKHCDQPKIIITEYKTSTKSKLRGRIQNKLEEWDDISDWTEIDGTFYLKYIIDNQ